MAGLIDEALKKDWSVVYKTCFNDDGSSIFPEKLPIAELSRIRKEQGPYIFANQYLNKIVPAEERKFKQEWIKYYKALPEIYRVTAFIDPAIGQESHHDYTALTVVYTDPDLNWYVRIAKRARLNPTQIVQLCFKVAEEFGTSTIGIESVAYQEALFYMLDEEMKRRKTWIAIKDVKRSPSVRKNQRIEALIPRFEWGNIYLNQGLTDLEDEFSQFPRGAHDDLLDSLASHDEIIVYPDKPKENLDKLGPAHPQYEKRYIESLKNRRSHDQEDQDYE